MGIKNWARAVTAAITGRNTATDSRTSPGAVAADLGWTHEAEQMYDIVPELRYGISWIASSASRAALIVARVPDHPAAQPIPVDEEHRAAAPLYDLAPTAPDQSVLIQQMVTLLKLVGKWWLIGFDDEHTGQRRWLVVSQREYREHGAQVQIKHPDTGADMRLTRLTPETRGQPGTCWVIPMWYPHPLDSCRPDSPVRALIDTLHELVDLSGHVQTAARSRLAGAGLLLIPSSLSTTAPGQSDGVNPPKGSGLMRALIRTAQASIKNPHDVSRHLPTILSGNAEALNAVRHLTLDTPFAERVDDLRTSAVRRIAIGLDIPPEVLSGMGDLNHWTAWQVDSAGQKINVAPTLAFICRELTAKYLHPSLRAMGVPDPEQYMVWYDDTALENTPNKAEVALAAYEQGLISPDAARETIGYGPADAPPPGWVPPVVQARLNARDQNRATELARNGTGPAAGQDTQVVIPAAANGWVACADVAARRALGKAGAHLLGSGGRQLRGKYRDTPIHDIHTKVTPANRDIAERALAGAFGELEAVEPALVAPVTAYTRDRLTKRAPHDVDVLTTYLNTKDMSCL